MKRVLYILLIFIVIFIVKTNDVYADVGPKPSITIFLKNMPDTICYMDLLVEEQSSMKANKKFDGPKYNKDLVARLRGYHEAGMSSLLVNGLGRMYGDIICDIKDGKCSLNYSYMVPDKFKIIVASDDGDIVVSNLIERNSFDSIIYFDYKSAQAKEVPFIISGLLSFLLTCILTIITEGIALYLFKFRIRENIKAFLIVNISTQVFLYIMISFGMVILGMSSAFVFYLLAEVIIFIVEAILFSRLLTQHSKLRRIVFSITSNFGSLLVGILVVVINIFNALL